jgi:hypothetical protein
VEAPGGERREEERHGGEALEQMRLARRFVWWRQVRSGNISSPAAAGESGGEGGVWIPRREETKRARRREWRLAEGKG